MDDAPDLSSNPDASHIRRLETADAVRRGDHAVDRDERATAAQIRKRDEPRDGAEVDRLAADDRARARGQDRQPQRARRHREHKRRHRTRAAAKRPMPACAVVAPSGVAGSSVNQANE